MPEQTPGDGAGEAADTVPIQPTTRPVETQSNATVPIEPLTEPVDLHTRPLPVVEVVEVRPKRKRRRWIGVLVGFVVLVALIVAALFIAEPYVRAYAEKQVRSEVIDALNLPKSTVVNVDLGTGSLILQAAIGRINDVRVSLPEFSVGGLTGSAVLKAKGVPLDSSKKVDALNIIVAVPEKGLQSIARNIQGSTQATVKLHKGLARVATSYSLFGISIPLAVDIKPTAAAGKLKFTPVNFYVNNAKVSLKDVRASPIGGLVGSALGGTELCVAEQLPKSFVLSNVNVDAKQIVLTVTGDGVALNGKALAERGSCK